MKVCSWTIMRAVACVFLFAAEPVVSAGTREEWGECYRDAGWHGSTFWTGPDWTRDGRVPGTAELIRRGTLWAAGETPASNKP
ncbi:MAG: hypothetical protein HZA91_17510 [Verrucomicrobia bacterium]|nr:hypothetical protein [Verrucomicrobiota bacterium]